MGFMDSAKDAAAKATEAAKENSDKIKDGVDKVADLIDDKTGNKHADKVDKAQEAIHKKLDSL